jgi:hypothetical protein
VTRRTAARATLGVVLILIAAALDGCGSASNSNVNAARRQAIRRAHHTAFPVPPCSLITRRQASAALGVPVRARAGRNGCLYEGTTRGGDRRSLTVTPGRPPASGQLISARQTHQSTITGAGYRARIGVTPAPGDVRVPAAATGGLVSGRLYVALLVEDADPSAGSQAGRVATVVRAIGRHLHAG